MDAGMGHVSPFILRTCFVLVFACLVLWHISVLHTTNKSRTPANPEAQRAASSFSTPRTFYSGKRVIQFDWNQIHGLAEKRITGLERDFWEATSVPDGSVSQGCSTLFPSHSPASSCWQHGAGLREQSVRPDNAKKPLHMKVSFLEVPQGETATSAMAKRMQEVIDQASIDAHTEAISKGLSGTQAQHYAEVHRQQLLQSNPEQLAAQHLPIFDLDSFDLQTMFPEMLGEGENGERLAALSSMMRSLIEQLETTIAALGVDEDDYEEPSLEESLADDRTINKTYSNIKDMLPVNLHGQPACPVAPRLAPIHPNILNTPWLPILKQLFSNFGRVDSDDGSTADTSTGSITDTRAGDASEGTLEGQAGADMRSSGSITPTGAAVAAEDTDTLQDDVNDVWEAANAAQRQIELALTTERLPPPYAENYAKQRLQQVSHLSRRIDDDYHRLYLQRMRAKRMLYTDGRSGAEEFFHSFDFGEQMSRLLSILHFAMGPVSDEHEAMDLLWRDLVYAATLQTRAVACISAGGDEEQCYNQAAAGTKPPAYAPFEELTLSQQLEFRGLLKGLFNASVPQPPVRPPVLHWDTRVDSTQRGRRVHLKFREELEEQAASLWVQGRGEPRQDAWQVIEALAGRHTDDRDELVKALQAQAVQRYLCFQVHQLLSQIEEWSEMMEPEQIRDIILEWRNMRSRHEPPLHGDLKPAAAATSEELLAQLRAKLGTRSEDRGREQG